MVGDLPETTSKPHTHKITIYEKKIVPRVRLELTTSASLSSPVPCERVATVYKYGALTDCATGADVIAVKKCSSEF